ncbi:MAG: TonB-dependent receptor [Pyrinomonadaceae bacterium]|nr:TonB-dependent receptor [Pyrinomonadaceae bacterium]
MPRTPEVCPTVFCSHSSNIVPHTSRVPPPVSWLVPAVSRLPPASFSLPSASCLLPTSVRLLRCAVYFLLLLSTQHSALSTVHAQGATATLSGSVVDQNGAVVPDVNIAVISIAQGFQRSATTKEQGTFVVPLLPPGKYTVKAEREGFTPAEVRDVVLNVNDQVAIRIHMKVGTLSQTVEIVEGGSLINESPAVSTVVDRAQVGNMPLNGRSFQSLITLSPGVVLTKAGTVELGQFSVNGQRADANYFTVDGVSANVGTMASNVGQFVGGTLPGLSVTGGTNNLVSVDALQEFRIQTSSYAAEFGRQPGAQVQIATRSGTNDFHGTLFDYFRNDVFDANDWFSNANRLAKPATRQHDFGGVIGGPIMLPRFGEGGSQPWYNGRNRTFFFFSYEGLRLRQPQTASRNVPTLATRLNAPLALQPYLSVFPLPNGPNTVNGYAQFNASFSVPSSLDATSIRIDHTLNSKLTLFARYNHAPSDIVGRGVGGALSVVNPIKSKTVTFTTGATYIISPKINNDFRVNYSTNSAKGSFDVDGLGGGVRPADSVLFPSFTSSSEAGLNFTLFDGNASYILGAFLSNLQRQLNFIDNVSLVTGAHQIKFGIDYRRVFPKLAPRSYTLTAQFTNVSQVPTSTPFLSVVQSETTNKEPVFTNLSLYGQDTWRVRPRLTLTYGLRWEVNPPPSEKNGNNPAVATGFDNPATISLLPLGTPLYRTTYNNFAPRIGVAYQLFQHPGRETVLRGGFGIFYDLGTGTAGGPFQVGVFPYGGIQPFFNTPFPLTPAQAAPPTVNLTSPTNIDVRAFDPNLKLPRTYQWNIAVEQSLGANQTISASYVAAAGRRLLRQELIAAPNPTFAQISITRNAATSDYHSFQVELQRRMSKGLQALASYTWARSFDNGSLDSVNTSINTATPVARLDPQLDRGPSDFDVRHAFSAAVSYNIPAPAIGSVGKAILNGWAIDTIMTARSATPVNVTISRNIGFGSYAFRPDLVPGIPLYLDDPNAPGGRRFNNTPTPGNTRQVGPFLVPTDARQGNLGRNALRGFPVYQLDFALRRQFSLTEKLKLQFKGEIFNILNHPNFGDPVGNLGFNLPTNTLFGRSDRMWGRSIGTGGTIGGFNPLYQVGGPRSMQFSLRLQF